MFDYLYILLICKDSRKDAVFKLWIKLQKGNKQSKLRAKVTAPIVACGVK